jgi:hypothetical protein
LGQVDSITRSGLGSEERHPAFRHGRNEARSGQYLFDNGQDRGHYQVQTWRHTRHFGRNNDELPCPANAPDAGQAMIRIGDRLFLHAWQALRAATQPGPEATSWQTGAVTWHRTRLSHACAEFSAVHDAYSLVHSGPGARWHLLVVMETWWDAGHRIVRSQVWATHMSGSKTALQDWIRSEAARLERNI